MKRTKELVIERVLLGSALITIAVTVGIIVVLTSGALSFFAEVPLVEFLTDTQWTPLFTDKNFGILPLLRDPADLIYRDRICGPCGAFHQHLHQ